MASKSPLSLPLTNTTKPPCHLSQKNTSLSVFLSKMSIKDKSSTGSKQGRVSRNSVNGKAVISKSASVCAGYGPAMGGARSAKTKNSVPPVKDTFSDISAQISSSLPVDNIISARPTSPRFSSLENLAVDTFPTTENPKQVELEMKMKVAATDGNAFLLHDFLLNGGDPEMRDPVTGDTLLHYAARGGGVMCITMLAVIIRNAITITNNEDQTPLMVAAANGHVKAVNALFVLCKPCWKKQFGGKELMKASADGNHNIVKVLLEGGVSPNQEENQSGPSPLHAAASNGHITCLKILIEKGADIALLDAEGQTALHKAANNGHNECVGALLAAGANPLNKDSSGWEPLHLAARGGHIECVKLFLASGVDVDRPAANKEPCRKSAPNKCMEMEKRTRSSRIDNRRTGK